MPFGTLTEHAAGWHAPLTQLKPGLHAPVGYVELQGCGTHVPPAQMKLAWQAPPG